MLQLWQCLVCIGHGTSMAIPLLVLHFLYCCRQDTWYICYIYVHNSVYMSQMWQCHVHGTQNVHTLSACNRCIIVMCAVEGAAWMGTTAVEDAVLLSAAYNLLKQHGPCTLCAIKHGPFIARHKGTLVSETKDKDTLFMPSDNYTNKPTQKIGCFCSHS